MKLVTYLNKKGKPRLGFYWKGKIYNAKKTAQIFDIFLPSTIEAFLEDYDEFYSYLLDLKTELQNVDSLKSIHNPKLIAPVNNPTSCRDGYAFRQHVEAARRNRGLDMIPEFDQYPVFYFTNHNSVIGEGDVIVELDHLKQLDFELEWAVVIGEQGCNIPANEADDFIAGFTIMNDLSARTLQMEEMKLNLGPAKGKDFATSIGPYLVTPEELEDYKISTDVGNKYNLDMKAYHNGKLVSFGNTKDMNWTFAQLIERASYGVELYPGDIIGSGTVGTGCYLELNGTYSREAKEKGDEYTPVWLQDGDEIVLEITALGSLKNKIKLTDNKISILDKKIRI